MKFEKALNEKAIPITGKSKIGMRYVKYRGINGIVIDEGVPKDVHGIPKGFEAYGRGGFMPDGTIFIDGGPQGSRQGHPHEVKNGFYWGVDREAKWNMNGKSVLGLFFLQGRAGTESNILAQNLEQIMSIIFKRFK